MVRSMRYIWCDLWRVGWSTEVMDVVLGRWVECVEKPCDDDARE